MIEISAYQGFCTDDFDRNLQKVYEVIRNAGKDKADFLCFPEGYLSNYKAELAVPMDDSRIQDLTHHTEKYDMVVIVGVSEKEMDSVFNTALVLYKGEMLGKYRKTMLTGNDIMKKSYTY